MTGLIPRTTQKKQNNPQQLSPRTAATSSLPSLWLPGLSYVSNIYSVYIYIKYICSILIHLSSPPAADPLVRTTACHSFRSHLRWTRRSMHTESEKPQTLVYWDYSYYNRLRNTVCTGGSGVCTEHTWTHTWTHTCSNLMLQSDGSNQELLQVELFALMNRILFCCYFRLILIIINNNILLITS